MGNARVTHETVEVLSQGPANARIYDLPIEVLSQGPGYVRLQQIYLESVCVALSSARVQDIYLEVLEFPDVDEEIPCSASDTLTFTEDWFGFVTLETDDTVTFSDIASTTAIRPVSFSDTLTFTETVATIVLAECSDSLTFTDDMSGYRDLNKPASDTLTLSETVALEFIATRSIHEGLVFSETIARQMIRLVAATDSVSLSDVATGTLVKPVSDTITFSESLTVFLAKLLRDALDFDSIFYINADFLRQTADVFEMYDSIFLNTYMRLPISETLTFTETFVANRVTPLTETIVFSETITATSSKITTDVLTFIDSVTVNKVKNVSYTDQVTFTDAASPTLVLQQTIEETLTLIEQWTGIGVRFGTASDSFAFSDLLLREIFAIAFDDSLSFSDDADCVKEGSRDATDTLAFSDSIFVNSTTNLTITDTLEFKEKRPADYQPSSSIGIPDGPEGSYGTVADRMMVFIGAAQSVIISPAEFNDYTADRNQVIFKRRMNGSVTTFIKTCPDEKLHYEFLVGKPKADEFRAFLDAENGRAFTIYDWKGQVWIAKLLTDTIDKEEVGRWEPCGNKTRITVEFLGRRYA